MRCSLHFAFALIVCHPLAQQAFAQESKAAVATRQKLKQKISVDFKETRNADIFAEIKGEMDKPVNFKIDNVSGVSNNSKLTYKATDKTVEQILNEISDKGEYGWIVISNPSNNKIDGWVIIRKNSKGKERGYEAGKDPKKSASLERAPKHWTPTSLNAGKGEDAARWNFEDAAVGKLPSGWSSAKTGKGDGSVWTIAEDKSAPDGSKVLAQTAAGPNSLFNLCVADKTSFTDLDLSVAFKSVAGKRDQGGGPVWRYQDADNYYVVRANPLEDNFRVYKFVAGKRIQIGSADIEVAPGKWHTIRVVHKGNQIQCHLNGKLLLDVKDDTFKTAGKIGLWTKADAHTYFDGIVIRKLD